MKFGPIEIYWNRVSAVVPAYVDFSSGPGNGVGTRPGVAGVDLAPIKVGLSDLKDELGTVIDNQNGLDALMRKVGAATDRSAGVAAAALELLQKVGADSTSLQGAIEALRLLFDERINQLFGLMEDAAGHAPAPQISAPISTDPELTSQTMNDLGAKEEERSPGGRRIWAIGRVRVYECRVGGGEDEVRGAIKEIISLRSKRDGYGAAGTVDILAVAIIDLSFGGASDKNFINNTVLQRISFVPPEYLATFVRLCLRKQPASTPTDSSSSATTSAPPVQADAGLLAKVRSKAARAHGQLQSNHTRNALALLAEILRLLGQEEPGEQTTPKGKNTEAPATTEQPAPTPDPNETANEMAVEDSGSPTGPPKNIRDTEPPATPQAAKTEPPPAMTATTTEPDIKDHKQTRRQKQPRSKEVVGNDAQRGQKGQTGDLQLPLTPAAAKSDPALDNTADPAIAADQTSGNAALQLVLKAPGAAPMDGEQRA